MTFIQLSSVLKTEAPSPFEIYKTARRYLIRVRFISLGRSTRAVELSSQV